MATNDTSVSINPYFKAKAGQLEAFKVTCEKLVNATASDPGCLYVGFGFDGDQAYCREAYKNADAWVAHLSSVGAMVGELLQVSDITRLEIVAPASELPTVKKVLGDMGMQAQIFTLEYGVRR